MGNKKESDRIKERANLVNKNYEDMIYLSRPVSPKHPPMERAMRAAQFSSFAALTGYSDIVKETARRTEAKPELDEEHKHYLDEMMKSLLGSDREAEVTYFIPDERKEGGELATVTGKLVRIDAYQNLLLLTDGTEIPIQNLYDIIDFSGES